MTIRLILFILILTGTSGVPSSADAQIPPTAEQAAGYGGLHQAALNGDLPVLEELLTAGAPVDDRDSYGRTPLHVAAYRAQHDAMRRLIAAGADPNALERDFYDIVTIASVADDVATLRLALELGASPSNVTSRYDGTALIAAAHLGHVEVVEALVAAGAPLDHVNNLQWTALIESIVLGNGGPRHTATLRALVNAGANVNLQDGRGQSPLTLARSRGFSEMARILEAAGAR
ncbi:MAG: ankyrin repeat domain-containing protein [Chloroflexota bacterium]